MDHRPTPDDADRGLLAAYVNGTLAKEDRAHIERLARDDQRLADEIAVLQALKRAVADGAASAPADELGWRRLQRALHEHAETGAGASDRRPPEPWPWWRAVAAALALVVIGQGVLLATAPGYEPAGVASGAFILQVAFQPEATEAAIRALLGEVDGQIQAGPSALGLYQVGFADSTRRDAALATLVAREGVVVSANLP